MANKKNNRHHRNGHRRVFWLKKTAVKYTPRHVTSKTITKHPPVVTQQTSSTQSTASSNNSIPIDQTNPPIISQPISPTTSSTTLPSDPHSSTLNSQLKEQNITVTIEGSRIINIDKLSKYVDNITVHPSKCGGNIVLTGEKRYGLASVLSSKCTECEYEIVLETSNKVKGPNEYTRWECNLAAVWGQMATGGGHTPLKETMSVLGVPVMTKSCFQQTERDIGEWWTKRLKQAMLEAGQEEKRLAQERNDYHQGVPSITVVVDGGWSTRSHKHSYNAKSGVGIIIGHATGKLLYIGVQNKYCTACSQGIPQDKHKCYKNWEDSSSEMEADIILEGFKQAEKTHGVRYLRFVGDGDSSVYPTLIQHVPVWSRFIKKMECANHAVQVLSIITRETGSRQPNLQRKRRPYRKNEKGKGSQVLQGVLSRCVARKQTEQTLQKRSD